MKTIVTLNKAIVVKGKEVTEISLDFNRITGSDLLKAEKDSRALGDQSPSVFLSMTFHAVIAAKLIGVPPDDIMALPATDFRNIVFPVASFFIKLGGSTKDVKKLALDMAVNSYTPVGFYLSCPVYEMLEYAELLKEMQKK